MNTNPRIVMALQIWSILASICRAKNLTSAGCRHLMKRTLLVAPVVGSMAACLVVAQGRLGSNLSSMSSNPITYDPKFPPPLALPDAYALAVSHMGSSTNSFHCVTASALERTNSGWAGWTFLFSNTNNDHTRVVVFYDKRAWTDPQNSDFMPNRR
jgi:hypothetical protein